MRYFATILIVCVLFLSFACPQPSAAQTVESAVTAFKKTVSGRDRKALAEFVAYPLQRMVPLPRICNPEQFLEAFDEILDDALLRSISASTLTEDWAEMGWRGIMFQNGALWLNDEGKITAINYQTEPGKNKRAALMEAERKSLHASLRQFMEPVLEWKTIDYRIRIDRISDDTYRYAVWPVHKEHSEKPDLVLNNGSVTFEGSGGNHHYDFKSGTNLYRCYVNLIGASDMQPGELEVQKHNKVVLSQSVLSVITGR
jgi:hypothetical protein